MNNRIQFIFYSAVVMILCLTEPSLGCSVCFGGNDSNLAKGFFWGVIVLGLLPFLLISSFVGFLLRAQKKHSSSEYKHEPAQPQ